MKRLLVAVAMLAGFAAVVFAQDNSNERWFVKGYLEGGLHPPHNEVEMNLRRPDLPETNGFGDNFGRYVLRGEIFAGYRLENKVVKSVFVLVKPYFVFGRTVPQLDYTWSARLIGYAENYGIGVELPRGWKVYAETHRWSLRDQKAVPGDGPFGLNSGLYVRKEFNLHF
ncbi:MAG: hypothetical protein A2998_02510 [Candidatus Staskawiczbacteria bacterium RIFCSPLOWO2_01_FULL_37_25b]|uniref:Outer membrane protein beta-barrel domain-containing protein n=1 Tax=Candidatus Staskawiczbacteria bacterium RIFCSPLOWO2_01_FULL_37_25b TaxID=1802213 RepID=A0A1G2IDU9_9BACT|nr:MAG: hypothetical protein A2998_02510 [Candidatus Staskawiczbacteria bacterium RIFCSPLOWO2_01_FULL_37_25b]